MSSVVYLYVQATSWCFWQPKRTADLPTASISIWREARSSSAQNMHLTITTQVRMNMKCFTSGCIKTFFYIFHQCIAKIIYIISMLANLRFFAQFGTCVAHCCLHYNARSHCVKQFPHISIYNELKYPCVVNASISERALIVDASRSHSYLKQQSITRVVCDFLISTTIEIVAVICNSGIVFLT